jgi:O-antigen/teichoic acid export membrane protein
MPVMTIRKAVSGIGAALRKSAPLLANSGALAIGTLTTAGLGLVYWWIAARSFPPEAIGRASALLAVIGLIGILGDAGLGTLLVGEISRHRNRAPGLVVAALAINFPLLFAMSALFLAGEAYFAGQALTDGWFDSALFVFGSCLTGASGIGSQAQLGNLRSAGRMVQQVMFAVIKLVLIVAAVAVGVLSDDAILATWFGGLTLSWLLFDLVTTGDARKLVGRPDYALLGTLRRKVFGHYVLDVAVLSPGAIMPYLVLVLLSPTTNAAFASMWMLVSMAAIVPAVLATALFPVAVANPDQARHDIMVSLSASLLFSGACAAFLFVFSQELLALFNPAYPAIAGDGLRLLGFGLLGLTLKFHLCALARLGNRMRKAALWFAFGAALEFGAVVIGARADGLSGLVLGWTAAVSVEGVVALGIFLAVPGLETVAVSPLPQGFRLARSESRRSDP